MYFPLRERNLFTFKKYINGIGHNFAVFKFLFISIHNDVLASTPDEKTFPLPLFSFKLTRSR